MSASPLNVLSSKALPVIGKDKLPPPPPQDAQSPSFAPPQPPPKLNHPGDTAPPSPDLPLLPSDAPPLATLSPNHNALPPTPNSPLSTFSADSRVKRSNPLIDLIETEKVYVDQLTGIIRKIASAWSRSNLPPPDLDLMFRALESVYKANRSLLTRLKDIGTNPSSPKALGDLLMRWIDELEAPYTSYCERYCTGFDVWDPVRNNARLLPVLASFSATNPPPLPPGSPPHPSEPPLWTLDELFILPKGRLKYYKKLYNRLLKGTQPGRNDYKLLIGASEKLERLLATVDARTDVKAGASSPVVMGPPETEDEVVVDFRSRPDSSKLQSPAPIEGTTGSETSSARGSSLSSAMRLSNETGTTSVDRTSSGGMTLTDLERRLSTDRCLDIFTMQPKQVRLQINPANLPYVREVRMGVDVSIRLVPRSTGASVHHPQGRIFILSDLFLVAERMTPAQKISNSTEADMWLLYPPLAGKHLKLSTAEGPDNTLHVNVMRKEKLTLEFESVQLRDKVYAEFMDCVEFASAVYASSKHPVPPLPPKAANAFPGVPGTERSGLSSSHTAPDLHLSETSRSPPPNRMSSPFGSRSNSTHSPQRGSDPPSRSGAGTPGSTYSLGDSLNKLSFNEQPGPLVPPRAPSLNGHPEPWHRGPPQQAVSGNDQPPQIPSGPAIFRGPSLNNGGPPNGVPPNGVPPNGVPPRGTNHSGPLYVAQPHPSHPGQLSLGPPQAAYPPRVASAGPLGRPGGPPYNGPPGRGMEPPVLPFGSRAPASAPQSPVDNHFAPPNAPFVSASGRAPSDPSFQGGIRKTPSTRSFSQPDPQNNAPPLPNFLPRKNSSASMGPPPRAILPSAQMSTRSFSMSYDDPSPPTSPTIEAPPIPTGPITSTISAQMKCKVFLKQHHAQWKSLGSAKLKLWRQQPTNEKQLVVEADDKHKTILISTIVLTDGVERVGKTGVAVELSDKGQRTGIVYMIQLRNEQSTVGLYESLLAGSDRAVGR
ncbi:hypothetical protein FA95DRAFT_1586995 [Auriscalpium vulgare]|uniref:Uncharacterized protein n=1 Tax=Auriscalpium vulgare TaxID=40419 RepID=A0ACB8S5Z4_9AGAM|nr:hypothetical protein FA95DRAFT_1586995 [Auriscalpium vulgare]